MKHIFLYYDFRFANTAAIHAKYPVHSYIPFDSFTLKTEVLILNPQMDATGKYTYTHMRIYI
jgi:hypothetical protein